MRLTGTDLRYTERVRCLQRRRTLAVIGEFLRVAGETGERERAAPECVATAPSAFSVRVSRRHRILRRNMPIVAPQDFRNLPKFRRFLLVVTEANTLSPAG